MTRRQDPSIEWGADPPRRADTSPQFSASVRSSRSPHPPRPPRSPRSGATGFRLVVTLCALILLILAGTLVWQNFLEGVPTVPLLKTDSAQHGPFASPPLNAQQVNELHHLATRMRDKQLASLYVARMSLDEELGQLIMVEYDDQYYSPDLDTMITQLHAGGVIMYEFQMMTLNQTKHDIAAMQQHATLPLLVSTDEEGGIVHRLTHIYPPRPSALSIYKTGDPNVATEQGHKVAQDLLSLGINVNLAPDVDVALQPDAPDQVTRTFGYTVNSVEQFAGPYMQAMQNDGVIACIKHFPGLGDATIDAHAGLPVVNRTKEQLYAVELAPFKHFIQTQDRLEKPGMVMPTDVLMPAIDPVYPAELSPNFMTDILRKEFGYDGVTLTDALYMKGVEIKGRPITMPEAAVLALNAGNDMLLGPTGAGQMLDMLNGIKQALHDGRLSRARVDEAATRIIALKMERHLMPAVPPRG